MFDELVREKGVLCALQVFLCTVQMQPVVKN